MFDGDGPMMSPIAPFFSEWLYKNLTDNIRNRAKEFNTPLQVESVHHSFLETEAEWRRGRVGEVDGLCTTHLFVGSFYP
ncbi:MAG: hypothetical protein U5K54_01060 [Cytophagales bacterium]|nr:hypothetical protein [Cytophagales bacterium]